MLDWSFYTQTINYAYLVERMEGIATSMVADFLAKIFRHKRMQCEQTHLIGFSLGAHLAGMTGRELRERECTLATITGKVDQLIN